jgi:hypothetical protein
MLIARYDGNFFEKQECSELNTTAYNSWGLQQTRRMACLVESSYSQTHTSDEFHSCELQPNTASTEKINTSRAVGQLTDWKAQTPYWEIN